MVVGEAERDVMMGEETVVPETVTVVGAVTEPLLLVAVIVYVVVCVGETVTDPEESDDWEPTPLSILTEVAPDVFQERVVEPPEVIVVGEAEKEEMVGAEDVPPLGV
jgi:hypothetical protein